jgi:hypothetical protein
VTLSAVGEDYCPGSNGRKGPFHRRLLNPRLRRLWRSPRHGGGR